MNILLFSAIFIVCFFVGMILLAKYADGEEIKQKK
jgi:hypothetical protein